MKKYLILLAALGLGAPLHAAPEDFDGPVTSVTRGRPGENWKLISRGSFGSGATALTLSAPGTYMLTESITSTASTAIISITSDDVTLDLGGHTIDGTGATSAIGISVASGLENITIRNGHVRDTAAGEAINVISAKNVLLENITAQNATTANYHVITFGSSSSVTLRNVNVIGDAAAGTKNGINFSAAVDDLVIDGFRVSGMNHGSADGVGIFLTTGSNGIVIKNGVIANCTGNAAADGITFSGACYDVTIENVNISNVAGQGIDLAGSYGVKMNNITVSAVAGASGIALGAGYGIAMKDITIANVTGDHGINLSGYDVTIDGFNVSQLTNASGSGIYLASGADGITIRNGSISDITGTTDGHGIYMQGTHTGITIENVNITNTGDNGIHVQTSCDGLVVRNVNINTPTQSGIDITLTYGALLEDIVIANPTADGIIINGASRNVTIRNVDISTAVNGLNIGSTAAGVTVDGLHVAGATDGILINAAAYGLRFKNLYLSACTSNGIINTTGAAYDIVIEDFNIANADNDAILFDLASYNVTLKNGTISDVATGYNAIRFDPSSYGLHLENITCSNAGLGIFFDGDADSTSITDVTLKNCKVSNITDSSAYGIRFKHTESILMQDCSISAVVNTAGSSDISGVLFETCTNVKCINVESGGHQGDNANGFLLTSVNGGYFENCSSRGCFANSETLNKFAAGFYLSSSNGCLFKKCESSGHQAVLEAYGFYLSSASGNHFYNCKAFRSNITNSANGVLTAVCAGFYSNGGKSNSWDNCEANGHVVNSSSVASTDGYGAAGFFLADEQQSSIYKCISRGNGLVASHLANATGIFLDGAAGQGGTDCKYCQIRECEASANCTSQTSGTTAYGIRDVAADTTNMIIDCFAFGNTDAASPRKIQNYQMDLPIGGSVTPDNWPRVEANMDGLIDIANKPLYYNVSITS